MHNILWPQETPPAPAHAKSVWARWLSVGREAGAGLVSGAAVMGTKGCFLPR